MKDYTNLISRLRGETREIPLPTILDMEAADAIEDLMELSCTLLRAAELHNLEVCNEEGIRRKYPWIAGGFRK